MIVGTSGTSASAQNTAATPAAGVINLSKGGKINLTKEAPGLKKIMFGLGWDCNKYSGGDDFDLDASVFLLDKRGKARPEEQKKMDSFSIIT